MYQLQQSIENVLYRLWRWILNTIYVILLVFQKVIAWHRQNLYEVKAPCEVKGGAADTNFGSMTFDELWTLLTFNLS